MDVGNILIGVFIAVLLKSRRRELLIGKKKAVLRRREIRKREEENRHREKQEENKFLSIWNDTVKATSREGSPVSTPVRRSSVELRVEPLMENKQLARSTAAKLSMVSNSRSSENSSTADFDATSPRQQASPLVKKPQDKPKSSLNRSRSNVVTLPLPASQVGTKQQSKSEATRVAASKARKTRKISRRSNNKLEPDAKIP